MTQTPPISVNNGQDSALTERCPALAQITAVIVTFNSAHCVADLAQQLQGWPHVTVVDNGSADDTVARVRAALPQARVIALPANRGFGTANNLGFAAASTPYCLMINPDCALDGTHARALWQTAQAWPQAAIVVPQLTGSDGALQLNYGWIRQWWSARGPGAEGVACVGNACGAAMLLRMAQAPQGGWFDERFFLYYEDEDMCLRLLQERKPVVIDPAIRVGHSNRGSVRGARPWRFEYVRGFHHARSKVLFTAKHAGSAAARKHRAQALAGAVALLALRVFAPSPKHVARLWGRIRGLCQASVQY